LEKKQNSFLNYLESDKFYDRIHSSIFSWCKNNKEILIEKVNGHDIRYIGEIYDVEMDYKNVTIDSKEGTSIDFDLAIEITVDLEGVSGKYYDRESYTSRTWVMVSCTGTLDKKLNDFQVNNVDDYSKLKVKKPLGGDFVPYIKKIEYDEYATEILEKYYFNYYPDAKKSAQPINVTLLAKNMGLSVITTSISHDKMIFGQIFFADTIVELYDDKTNEYRKRKVKKDTILVDDNATYLRSYGSKNMTIAHECVHAYYHRKAFLFAQMFSKGLKYIQCQIDGKMTNSDYNETTEWMEIQANALAPYILMPKSSFEPYARELFDRYGSFGKLSINVVNDVIDELANRYQVTIYAARKRLIDLGFDRAIGAFNWVDGHYVKPYTFKKGSLDHNETYTISYKDVYKKVISGDMLMESINSNYVFVDNHLVINHPNYVEKNSEGNLELSMYALTHMDECCVKFRYKSISGFSGGTSFGLLAYLSRDVSKEIEFDLEIASIPKKNHEQTIFLTKYKIHSESVLEIYQKISGLSFGQSIEYIMTFLDIRVNELVDDSGVNERTLRRYLKDDVKSPQLRKVVAIIRALNLPPKLTEVLIKQSGVSFRPGNSEDDALFNVLVYHRNSSVNDVNSFLQLLGFKPLVDED